MVINRLAKIFATSLSIKNLRKNPPFLDQQHEVIQDQIEVGITEEVKPHLKESIASNKPCRTHYLSHHGLVRKEALSTKLRVVLDGNAKAKPDIPSLNERLYTGPSLL